VEERLVDVRPALVTHRERAVAGQPRQRALHYPPVPYQPLAAIFPLPGYPAFDAALPQSLTALLGIITFVSMYLVGAVPRSSTRTLDRLDSVEQFLEDL